MQTGTTLMARQPIYDTGLEVVAYELLFRSGDLDQAEVIDGDMATSQVILNAFTEIPFKDVLDGKPAYINFTRELLDNPPPIDGHQLVVEVLEDIQVDDELINSIKNLKKAGYIIALDDYVYDSSHHSLLQITDIIKIDVLSLGLDGTRQQTQHLSQYKVKLLAEKIETHEEFSQCKDMGFELFQGYFLAKPQLVKGRKIGASQQAVMRLFGVLQDPDVEFDEVDKAISSDPVLSFKLLRLINSAAVGLSQNVDSIHRAITILGMSKIKSFAGMLALTSHSSKPEALCLQAMTRAHMVQRMGTTLNGSDLSADQLFTVGLISTMDAFLDLPLEDVLNCLTLTEEIRVAILQHKGTSGLLLGTAIHFEQAKLGDVDWQQLANIGLKGDVVEGDYIESIQWAYNNAKEIF